MRRSLGTPDPPPPRTGPTANLPTLVGDGIEHETFDLVTQDQPRLGRFLDLGLLGEGAMGEVRRVFDQDLNRTMAMKILRAQYAARPGVRRRFIDEAQAAAQLQHPGIVPIHELGALEDGRPWFTMREVRGRTLGERIAAVHEAGGTTTDGWTLRRLVEALRSACEAVAYAHDRGVIHRDIKPDNVMIGSHGEVLVVDWGLAKVILTEDPAPGRATPPVATTRSHTGQHTRDGTVAGTPAYMPPEQARGQRLDPRADVYSLGAMLFTILYGTRPYGDVPDDAETVLSAVRAGPPTVPRASALGVPSELEEIRRAAMARAPEDRPRDAGALAAAIIAWLDGALQRERALRFVSEAASYAPRAAALRDRAATARAEATTALEAVPTWAPEAEKAAAWGLQFEGERADAEAALLDVQAEQLLHQALAWLPDLPEALLGLAEHSLRALQQAERDRRDADIRRWRALLEDYTRRLPPGHPALAPYRAWLDGRGTWAVDTAAPGMRQRVYRYVTGPGRMVLEPVPGAATAPGTPLTLPIGSYVAVVTAGRAQVRVPFVVTRGGHGTLTDATGRPVRLLIPDDLGPDDVFVAPGRWWSGGDERAVGSGPGVERWTGAFVMRRYPVTNTEYIAFLDDLVARGDEAAALRYAPRERGGTVGEVGPVIYGRDDQGRFVLRADVDGDVWQPAWPVFNADWHGAVAFAAWTAARTGQPWRLPTADEVEKAARGVDGRFYPWGDRFDASWCCMRDSHPGRPEPANVTDFPLDESPYGVRGLAGNVRAWCADGPSPGRRYDRGGFWLASATECRSADVHDHEETHRAAEVGVRLVRSV